MTSLGTILLDKEILLESGTNELEILVFKVADYTFGINVAKVREVLPAPEITQLPKAHPSVRGVFKLRNQVIPCVSLMDYLGIYGAGENTESTLILTDLNQQQTAFLVDQVDRIYRLSWEHILSVPGLTALSHTPVTALARSDDRLIVMLDFEMILDAITDQLFRSDAIENPMGVARNRLRLLIAEDSPTVREAMETTLRQSGYEQLEFFENGKQAWQWISQRWEATQRVEEVGDLLVCDVEMPQVDGFHLTKRLKSHPQLSRIPVLLYSSIITPENIKKGKAVGADAQVTKPELVRVVELADELISRSQQELRAEQFQMVATAVEQAEDDPCAQPPCGAEESGVATPPGTPEPSEQASSAVQPCRERTAPEPPEAQAAELSEQPLSTCEALEGRGADEVPSGTVAVQTGAAEPLADAVASEAPRPEAAADCQEQATESPQEEAPALEFIPAEPEGVDPRLWQTFMQELFTHRRRLSDMLDTAGEGRPSYDVIFQVARTLHTIKSAATVVPVDQVTYCTHLVESLLEQRQESGDWPGDLLRRYLTWLEMLTNPPEDDLEAALQSGARLAADLQAAAG